MKNIIVLLALFISVKGFSQDQLFKKDNSKLEVKILEINPTDIKYKLFSYQEGPTITILKSEVALIIYQNGVHEIINPFSELAVVKDAANNNSVDESWKEREKQREAEKKAEKEKRKADLENILSTKNSVTLNLMEPLNGCIGVTYMREFANHYLNVCLPINIGFTAPFMNESVATQIIKNKYSDVTNYNYTRKAFEIGLGVNFQTTGEKAVTHFIGPLVSYSQYFGTFDNYTYASNMSNLEKYNFTMNRWSFMINNGLVFRVTKNFGIILNAAIGYRSDHYILNDPAMYDPSGYKPSYLNLPLNAFKLGMSMGYRF